MSLEFQISDEKRPIKIEQNEPLQTLDEQIHQTESDEKCFFGFPKIETVCDLESNLSMKNELEFLPETQTEMENVRLILKKLEAIKKRIAQPGEVVVQVKRKIKRRRVPTEGFPSLEKIEEKMRKYECYVCLHFTASRLKMKQHIIQKHGYSCMWRKQKYACNYCLFSSSNKWRVQKHVIQEHSTLKALYCPYCFYSTFNILEFENHLQGICQLNTLSRFSFRSQARHFFKFNNPETIL